MQGIGEAILFLARYYIYIYIHILIPFPPLLLSKICFLGTVVSSCENALQWPLALNLRSTISNENVALTQGDVVLESAIISAWEKGTLEQKVDSD